MDRRRLVALLGAAAVTLPIAGAAVAAPAGKAPKAPAMTTIAKTGDTRSPVSLVDSSGTVSAVWIQEKYPALHLAYARKTVKATHFTTVALPGDTTRDSDAFIYEPSHGVLEIMALYNSSDIVAWRSTNDGVSWTTMNTDTLNATLRNDGYTTTYTSSLAAAPGGPLYNSGNGSVLQFNAALTTVSVLTPLMAASSGPTLARSTSGTVYQLAPSYQAPVAFQAGTHAVSIGFPACPAADNQDLVVDAAAGASSAVVLATACGHVWSRTVSPSGAVGRLVSLGRGVNRVGEIGNGGNADEWVGVGADSKHHFTAAWTTTGGDIQVARSSNGSKWSVQKKLVPTAYARYSYDSAAPSLTGGNPSWFTTSQAPYTNNDEYAEKGIALTDGYTPPAPPSARGIGHPHRSRVASLALTSPAELAVKSFKKNGRLTLSAVDALGGKVSFTVSDVRNGNYECDGSKTVTLTAHRAKKITVVCNGGGVVIGGTAASGVAAKKGDVVGVLVTGRVGNFTLSTKLI